MEDYDPLAATRKTQFPSELKNMGIDKDSILGNKEEKKAPPAVQATIIKDENYDIIKKRLDTFESQMKGMESRITNIVESMNRTLNDFHDKITKVRQNSATEAPPQKAPEKQKTLPSEKRDLQPGDIQIEDYFNFSNAKFKK